MRMSRAHARRLGPAPRDPNPRTCGVREPMQDPRAHTNELPFTPVGGWLAFGAWLLLLAGTIALLVSGAGTESQLLVISGVLMIPVCILGLVGFFIVNPNESRVLVLFGRYRGSVRREGFFWTNPFTAKHKISLRDHNLEGSRLKVNDLLGNPIEISAVVVWRVSDTARARFDVEDYEHYVHVQSEAAVRHLATRYPYDDLELEDAEVTLRGSSDEIAEQLQEELSQRLARAGIEIVEARLNHLAYAQEIASAMLQRQQAKAIIAARRQIVEGAVSMVHMALEQLDEDGTVKLDAEDKASLVGNLLVVLCGQSHAQPVISAGG